PLSPGRSTRPGCEWLRAGSHRGGAPTTKPVNPSPPVGAPVPGAKGACRFAPRRCSYKKAVNLSPSVGAPAPGANGCVPVRTEAVLLQKSRSTSSPGRSTRPGCEGCGADARRQNFLQQGLHVDARTSSGELIY